MANINFIILKISVSLTELLPCLLLLLYLLVDGVNRSCQFVRLWKYQISLSTLIAPALNAENNGYFSSSRYENVKVWRKYLYSSLLWFG